jgi:hypothetical protein
MLTTPPYRVAFFFSLFSFKSKFIIMTNANEHFGAHNGTENIYSCRPFPITYTDGVRDLVENCKSYWLIDTIISYQELKKVNCQPFQVWQLIRAKGDSFNLVATDGNDNRIASHYVPFSDFPFDMATVWLVDGTLLLPSEY